jgi:hypothetical protein
LFPFDDAAAEGIEFDDYRRVFLQPDKDRRQLGVEVPSLMDHDPAELPTLHFNANLTEIV